MKPSYSKVPQNAPQEVELSAHFDIPLHSATSSTGHPVAQATPNPYGCDTPAGAPHDSMQAAVQPPPHYPYSHDGVPQPYGQPFVSVGQPPQPYHPPPTGQPHPPPPYGQPYTQQYGQPQPYGQPPQYSAAGVAPSLYGQPVMMYGHPPQQVVMMQPGCTYCDDRADPASSLFCLGALCALCCILDA